MDYEQIKHHLKNSDSLKLLRRDNAPLMISFLYQQFKKSQCISIPQSKLRAELTDYLEFIGEEIDPEKTYPLTANKYLDQWCDEKLLQKTYEPGNDDPVFTLTAAIETVFKWLEELLQPPEFISTESRFEQIFDLLNTIVNYSTTDVETRLKELEKERDRIQEEINKIQETGEVTLYSPQKIKEKFFLAKNTAKQLLADFAQIEENFREIILEIRKAKLQESIPKGEVIGHFLEGNKLIRESPQGHSFYGFWNLLMSVEKREKLQELITSVEQLEALQSIEKNDQLLDHLERNLIEKARRIVEENQKIAKELNECLRENNIKEQKRVAELTKEILRLAQQIPLESSSDVEDFLILEGKPQLNLIKRFTLHPLEDSITPKFSLNFQDLPEVDAGEALQELYHQCYVDEKELERRIAEALEDREQITLGELVELYPIEQGLSEIVAYVAIATKSRQHLINDKIKESLFVTSQEEEKQLLITLAQIIFRD